MADLQKFRSPDSKLSLQRSLGMVNYYRHFLPGLSRLLGPLHQTVASAKKPSEFLWTEPCEKAFVEAKSLLAKATLLHHTSPFAQTARKVWFCTYKINNCSFSLNIMPYSPYLLCMYGMNVDKVIKSSYTSIMNTADQRSLV